MKYIRVCSDFHTNMKWELFDNCYHSQRNSNFTSLLNHSISVFHSILMHFLYKIKLYHQNMWVHFDPISLLDSNHIYGSEQLTKCAFEKPNARIHTYETASSFLSHKMSKQRQIDLFKRILHFYNRQMQDSLAYFCHVLDFRCLHHQKRTGSKL